MVILRELQEKDAPFMIEWMHDPDIQKSFKNNMMDATIDDAIRFIKKAKIPDNPQTGTSVHYAVADFNDDQYLGTVSLKNLDIENGTAEYAIIIRKEASGEGAAYTATRLILKKAFIEMNLHRVYLSVYANNLAAINLYEKSGFQYEGEFREHFLLDGKRVGWKWYSILKEEYNKRWTGVIDGKDHA